MEFSTLSTSFSTVENLIIPCRNSSFYGISSIFQTFVAVYFIFTQNLVNDYTEFVCIYINMQKSAGESLANRLGSLDYKDFHKLDRKYSVVSIMVNQSFLPISLMDLKPKEKYGVKDAFIGNLGAVIGSLRPSTVLWRGTTGRGTRWVCRCN